MKNFLDYCEARGYDLTFLREVPDAEGEGEATAEGSTMRAAVRSHAYPPAYGRAQRPKAALRPTAADAVTYQDLEGE